MSIISFSSGILIGILISGIVLQLWKTQRQFFKFLDWLLLLVVLASALFTLAMVSTLVMEPLPGALRAAGISAFLFGGTTIVLAMFLKRRVALAKKAGNDKNTSGSR
jgi:hypothetical protein